MKERNKLVKKSLVFIALAAALLMALGACAPVGDNTQTTAATQAQTTVATPQAMTASLDINCKNILDSMDKVPANKKEYVPENGLILNAQGVEIKEGETAFDFIKNVCAQKNIQLDYDSASSYVKSIGNINEKDCGNESGWMFKVNGESPSVGANQYVLKNGDKVEFFYILSYDQM